MVWTGSKEDLFSFFNEINTVHYTIKFDCQYSFNSINFLDTTVYKNKHNSLSTKLFTKPTDRRAYLHRNSCHPNSLIINIPYGQALRVKRICSEETDLQEALDELKKKFQMRGYNNVLVEQQFQRIHQIERRTLLQYKNRQDNMKLKCITTYNKNLPNIKSLIDKNWSTLLINDKQASIFYDKPILAFKRNKNPKDLIGGTHLVQNKKMIRKERKTGF